MKDKSALVEARKAIEREMERFKLCEKEVSGAPAPAVHARADLRRH